MTKEFRVDDKVAVVRCEIKARNGLVGTITEKAHSAIYGVDTYWVKVDTEVQADGARDRMYVIQAKEMDLISRHVSTEEKLAKVAGVLAKLEADQEFCTSYDDEWTKGGNTESKRISKMLRDILDD